MFFKYAQVALLIGALVLPTRAQLPIVGGLLGGLGGAGGLLGGGGAGTCGGNQTLVKCGLLDLSLQCEKQCDDTQVCVNVCTSLLQSLQGLLGGLPLLSSLPLLGSLTTCMCEDGFYRNRAGGCVAIDLCAHSGLNLKKRDLLDALPLGPVGGILPPVGGILPPVGGILPPVGGLLPPLGGGSAVCPLNQAVVSCGLLDLSLQCEKQCNDTQVCVNVCTNLLNTVGSILSLLPVPIPAISTCMCEDGFYRNRAGACVALDLCAHTGVNL